MLSIRQRLTLWYTLVLMVMFVAFAGVIYVGGTWQLRQAADRELLLTARQLTETLLRGEDPVAVDVAYRFLALDGRVVRSSGLPARRVPIAPAAMESAQQGKTWSETVNMPAMPVVSGDGELRRTMSLQVRMLTVPLGNPTRYILQVGKVTTDQQRLRTLLFTALLVALTLGLPAAAAGGWWLAGRALRPVKAITDTARRIEARNLSERLPQPPQDDELGQLAATLNGLLDRLQAAFQRERRFTADVSHDLRTPLALIKSNIGVTLNRPRTVEELQATLTEVEGQIDRMTGLVEATLFLARSDAEQLAQNFAALDLSELLADMYETTAPYASEELGQTLRNEIAPGLWVEGERDQLTRLFLNLLDNAMRYTPTGGTIRLAARLQGNQTIVDMEDNGPGIAPADLPRVFDRFYRADKARTGGDRNHHGLGLSIAQAIAQAHGGEITVKSAPGRGSCFTVTLPIYLTR
ncbi:MAG: hypothetical protein CVU38_16005 [Chloroflexi bacterium HGW-Chloroflexi-1]|nr:MAG: hypothetical protein CVU38_16005 [Chloroflexi bacterium HGW-Chloroflexi-1]